jgi:hypothetical protein
MHTDTDTMKAARFQAAMTANALERIAAQLETLSRRETSASKAQHLEETACELAHHADALREATGLNAATEANLARLLSNPRTI